MLMEWQKTKGFILFLLVVSLFMLTSCGGGSTSGRDTDFRFGSEALELQLINGGVEDFFEGDDMVILVEYFNRGTSDITDGEFFVSGYDLKYLTLTLDPKFINIPGKDEFDPQGKQSQILTIKSSPLRLPKNTEEFMQTVKLTACYTYRTLATAEVCIDPDPKSRRVQDKICTMTPVSPGGQGAPIVVTYVEPLVSRNDLRLNIEFSNQGNGIVFDRTISNAKCFADLDRYSDADKVDVLRVEYSGNRLNCQPSNPIRLVDGKGKVTCECKGCIHDYMDAYETLVTMEFAYGYRNEILKKVRILSE
jgi:hypothetical protein